MTSLKKIILVSNKLVGLSPTGVETQLQDVMANVMTKQIKTSNIRSLLF
jgi:hypothetical protein